jgi:ribonuclease-3
MSAAYHLLEEQLGYHFRQISHLESALTHKSYVNENPTLGRADNERLEFLGDAVLDLAISHFLMEAHPMQTEGQLSKSRAAIVNETTLAEVARGLSLGAWLFLGKGEEQSGGRSKASVLANAVEALAAAVYLDGGYGAALAFLRHLFEERVRQARPPGSTDYKTRLQEEAARRRLPICYTVVSEVGPDHDKTFRIEVTVGDQVVASGEGKSKKEGEQRAAELALTQLGHF